MKNNISKLRFILSLLLSFVVCNTCTKLEKAMLVSTGDVTNILTNTADASGLIIDLGDVATQHGHCYATTPNVTITGSKTQLGVPSATGGFTSQLTNLEAGTKYYIKAYISSGTETVFGEETNFTTVSASLPTLTTTIITSITTNSAISGGNITNDGGSPVTVQGVCWNTAPNPTIANFKSVEGTGSSSFARTLTGLTGNTTYYVKAYATNSTGTAYGNELTFKTGAVAPTVFTTNITAVTTNSAIGGGNIPNDGGALITMRGVCWGTSHDPTTANSNTIDGTGLGGFVSNLTGLTVNTTYYIRAYAFNGIDIGYGNELSFTTSAVAVVAPTLTTAAIGSINSTSATSGGSITSDGGASITAVGVCWSITSGPTIPTTSKTTDVLAAGTFTSSINGLALGVTYFVRAYATNSAGTGYGNEVSFTTALAIGDSYQGGIVAYILKLGDPGYTAGQTRGIIASKDDLSTGAGWGCIGTTITGADGIAIGTGNQNTTDIMAGCSTAGIAAKLCNDLVLDGYSDWYLPSKDELNKLYISQSSIGGFADLFYWSSTESNDNFAWNQAFNNGYQGISMKSNGNHVRAVRAFPPVPVLPALTTTAYSALTSTTATSGGNILSDGGAPVTDRGVCWNITTNPTIANNKTTNGTGTGSFASSLIGLAPLTPYFVRAYATNSAGTAYGNEISFTTSALAIGDSYQGGIVAYILQSGDPGWLTGQTHGLIASPNDQSTSAEWGCMGTTITGADGTQIGMGNQNTTDIIAMCATAGIAARLCGDLVLGGYSDWYLPSKDELNKMYLNKVAIGGFASAGYLSSSEVDSNTEWAQDFGGGSQGAFLKGTIGHVRAIRSF